ncbi:hypothetical protein BX666DRAFT_1857571 [Dichotomocladium elegans]|nr:hypothetical protein BX666DRAFT_1857571 [Dichotomocladium elegans]
MNFNFLIALARVSQLGGVVHHDVKHIESNGFAADTGQDTTRAGSGFFARVSSYPIVKDGVSTVKAYAKQSPVATYALSKANDTLHTMSAYQPRYAQTAYATYIQPHVQRADELGCKSLDLIQERFPVVTMPTAEVVSSVKTPPAHVIQRVRSQFEATVTSPAKDAATATNQRITTAIDQIESALNWYLPAQQPECDSEHKSESSAATHAGRAYMLLNTFTARVRARVAEQTVNVVNAVPRSRGDLIKLSQSSEVTQAMLERLQFVQETLRQSVFVYSKAFQDRFVPQTIQIRFQQLQQVLIKDLHTISTAIQEKIAFPDHIKRRLQSLSEASAQQYEFAKVQYARTDVSSLDKVKTVAQHIQSQLLPVLRNVESQIKLYTDSLREKAKQDLKAPVEFLGIGKADH